jgi:O-acetylhomoserine/O-acetylserine sulfhydrylase-like pyridoxal-dependent enzyme
MSPYGGLNTRSVQAAETPHPSTDADGVPIYQNATFAFRSYEGVRAWREGASRSHFWLDPVWPR